MSTPIKRKDLISKKALNMPDKYAKKLKKVVKLNKKLNKIQSELDLPDRTRIDAKYISMMEAYIAISAKHSNTPLVEFAVSREIEMAEDTRIQMLEEAIKLIR